MARRRYHEAYAGRDERRRMESADGDMIREGGFANLPEGAIMREWPRVYDYTDENLDDTIRGVDHQINADSKKQKKGSMPEKY